MHQHDDSAQQIHDIRKMMERSSRFISLSGLSGISAGVCALIGAALAHPYVIGAKDFIIQPEVAMVQALSGSYTILFNTWLFWIALGTLVAALLSAFIFTWIKSNKEGIPIWGTTAKRLIIAVSVPLIAGAVFIIQMLWHYGADGLIAPACLIFYGLGLINAGRFTFGEIRWLGYCELLLGLISLWFVGYGLYFWAMGFGILHIVYGLYMWRKYGG